MNLEQLSNLNANVCVSITLSDLREFLSSVAAEAEAAKPVEEEKYLTTDEVSKLLNVSQNTLWRWNRDKYLCHTKIGRTPFYLKSDVDSLLLKSRV